MTISPDSPPTPDNSGKDPDIKPSVIPRSENYGAPDILGYFEDASKYADPPEIADAKLHMAKYVDSPNTENTDDLNPERCVQLARQEELEPEAVEAVEEAARALEKEQQNRPSLRRNL